MKYHYLTGVKKSIWEYGSCLFWRLIVLLALVILYDIAFNNSRLFIGILVWTWK